MTLSGCLPHGIGNLIQMLLQHRKELGQQYIWLTLAYLEFAITQP
jgi:hypothetical protein